MGLLLFCISLCLFESAGIFPFLAYLIFRFWFGSFGHTSRQHHLLLVRGDDIFFQDRLAVIDDGLGCVDWIYPDVVVIFAIVGLVLLTKRPVCHLAVKILVYPDAQVGCAVLVYLSAEVCGREAEPKEHCDLPRF